jgi:hypothetical protein
MDEMTVGGRTCFRCGNHIGIGDGRIECIGEAGILYLCNNCHIQDNGILERCRDLGDEVAQLKGKRP